MTAHYHRLRDELGKVCSADLGVLTQRDMDRFSIAAWSPHSQAATAPPLFLSSVMGWGAGPPEEELDTDGTSSSDTRGLALTGVRLMGAGQNLEFHAPVREGTRVTARTSLRDIELKRGRTGQLLVLSIERQFTDEHSQLLVTCQETFIAR
ncbi:MULTISPECIES: MaoC family dehydratase N-terminal domain-containing protein [Actinomycetes]|uniref:FAS1-like dehydratase domain-containing protein n=1 Tax=Actinomycetes TaxID=1760 RepID=UPI00131A01E5|nr:MULTISPECIES: MaoC family dehydratase N-terminal domain-containing protein [Actinomycetes]